MGAPCGCVNDNSLSLSDYIALAGIIINSGLAIWIVRTIQNRLTNKRALKDHFINEIKDIRNEYRNCLNNLYLNKTQPQSVTPWFKLMNIKVNDLMEIIHSEYKVDKNKLRPYQIDLRELITNNVDFIAQFKNAKPIEFSETSRIQFMTFQQNNSKIFNKIIMIINNAD